MRQPRPRRLDNRNSRASESKASSSLECSAECSRESTKLTFYCVKYTRATPLGANFRASESKASSSLECSAERSRKSTKLKLVCEYRPGRPGFKSSLLRMGGFRREVEPLFRLRGDGGVFEKSLMIYRKVWNSLVNWIFICNFAA